MELTFDSIQDIGYGAEPFAVHTQDNTVQVIYVGDKGNVYAKESVPSLGQWGDLTFGEPYIICDDVNVEHLKLKNVAASVFVVWKNATVDGEVVPYQPIRHRFAVWEMRQDLTKYLKSGNLDFRLDDPVAKLSVNFENPGYIVSDEDDTLLTPGTVLTLFFRAGDSNRYILGKYFVDRNDMSVTEGTTSVSARNAIGKLLKDQTFDDDNVYLWGNLKTTVENIFKSFGVNNYFVSSTDSEIGMAFAPDMTGLDGFKELLKTISSWKLSEDMTGRIGFGDKNDIRFQQPETYVFNRNTDIFSRSVERDDADAYSRVCVYNSDRTVEVYRDVNFKFVMGRKKTLHAQVADGTILADANIYADNLATLVANIGVIETFNGPFKPYLQVGDNAMIIGQTTKLLGLVTSVRHSFGADGYYTEFVVDSGMVANRTRVSDYINKISGKDQSNSSAERLYSGETPGGGGTTGSKVKPSLINGNIIVDGIETTVYDDDEIRTMIDGKTNDYNDLENKPTINNNEISGNITLDDGSMSINNKNIAAKIWKGTKAQYDAISTKDNTMTYVVTDEFEDTSQRSSGTSANRPSPTYTGQLYFDTTLGRPIWCKSITPTIWVDSTGSTV